MANAPRSDAAPHAAVSLQRGSARGASRESAPEAAPPRKQRTHSKRQERSAEAGLDALSALGVSPASARLVRYYVLHPDARPYPTQLRTQLGLSNASLTRDLERLRQLGALTRAEEGRRVRYVPVWGAPFWRGVRLLLATAADPTPALRDALADVDGLDAAFVFGSMAKGTTVGPHSDVDVFVVERADADTKALHRQLAEVGVLLGREVNAVRYTPTALAERLGDAARPGARFVRDVLGGPKRWITGTARQLRPLATAAGVRLVGAPRGVKADRAGTRAPAPPVGAQRLRAPGPGGPKAQRAGDGTAEQSGAAPTGVAPTGARPTRTRPSRAVPRERAAPDRGGAR